MTAYGVRSEPGARVDAEPTDGLPTIRPGVDRMPTRCERCASTWLGYEEPLGPHQRGMLWCQVCSRSICWVDSPLPSLQPRRPSTSSPAGTTARRLIYGRRPIYGSTFERLASCGAACTSSYGHNARHHERAGADAVHAAIAAHASGDIATGPLIVQLGAGRVVVETHEVELSTIEYRLLVYLACRLDQLCTQDELLQGVWGSAWTLTDQSGAHLLRTNASRLRTRLGTAAYLLETVRGLGYRLADAPLC